jgi:hypothetical protein
MTPAVSPGAEPANTEAWNTFLQKAAQSWEERVIDWEQWWTEAVARIEQWRKTNLESGVDAEKIKSLYQERLADINARYCRGLAAAEGALIRAKTKYNQAMRKMNQAGEVVPPTPPPEECRTCDCKTLPYKMDCVSCCAGKRDR